MEQQKDRLVVHVDIRVEKPDAYTSNAIAHSAVHKEALAAGEGKGTIADSGNIIGDLIRESTREAERQVECLADEQVAAMRAERAKEERAEAERIASV